MLNWPKGLSAIRQSIRHSSKAPVALTSLDLHRSLSELLFLQELNRYQQAFIHRVFLAYPEDDLPGELEYRLNCIRHQESHYQETIEFLERRVENAINLLFNVTSFDETRSINRLTYLAFVFAPVSFATSVWGMTEFTIAPKWVAALAMPLLILSFFIAWLSTIISRKLDLRRVKHWTDEEKRR
ncbi:hypothetical protein N7532_005757 [Penicillium argentinense]|uniref:Uncharacterized protein n=1 Tax=Penicillium argentinense TaxID=1131581 RepID=A0A9W9FEP4_9EURO|nr:uncharacterized protein N7532_005757 [Penicillium argentinense]KAJ5098756.1 hypothetical protein N7532_005757 [Penicillium argentinense]